MRHLWALVGADGYYWTGTEFVPLFIPLQLDDCILFGREVDAYRESDRLRKRVATFPRLVQVHEFKERRIICDVG